MSILPDVSDRTIDDERDLMAQLRQPIGLVTDRARWLYAAAADEIEQLETAMREACDLLAERTHGSPARSPGHNARLRLEAALTHGERSDG